jgi:hypothetical protein
VPRAPRRPRGAAEKCGRSPSLRRRYKPRLGHRRASGGCDGNRGRGRRRCRRRHAANATWPRSPPDSTASPGGASDAPVLEGAMRSVGEVRPIAVGDGNQRRRGNARPPCKRRRRRAKPSTVVVEPKTPGRRTWSREVAAWGPAVVEERGRSRRASASSGEAAGGGAGKRGECVGGRVCAGRSFFYSFTPRWADRPPVSGPESRVVSAREIRLWRPAPAAAVARRRRRRAREPGAPGSRDSPGAHGVQLSRRSAQARARVPNTPRVAASRARARRRDGERSLASMISRHIARGAVESAFRRRMSRRRDRSRRRPARSGAPGRGVAGSASGGRSRAARARLA